jgi:hypothetical protein
MAQRSRPAFLRLVHSDSDVSRSTIGPSDTAPAQDSFLPSNHPNTLIFLAWGKASMEDLLDVFELSRPKLIFDMRAAPRFDLGQLTRKYFFELLRKYKCRYVDLLGRIGINNVKDSLANPALIAREATQFIDELQPPDSGPLVFIHEDDSLGDDYISNIANSLPCGTVASWQVYRPQASVERSVDRNLEAHERVGTTPLVRHTIFISHSTPHDNAFAVWLSSRLASAGYDTWCDVINLSGGDAFWRDIEGIIRLHAAKIIFVQSRHVKQSSGSRKEAYLALKVGERNRLKRFIIPMRIDDTPFDETLVELIDLQTIDCRRDWLGGLKSLLALLHRDRVPRATSFKADQFSELVSRFNRPAIVLDGSEEPLVSNLLEIRSLPHYINFFSCSGLQSNQMAGVATQLRIPAFGYYAHMGTTATRERFISELSSIGQKEIGVGDRARISWNDFLAANSGDLPGWKKSDARNKAFSMLHRAWSQHLAACGATVGLLANNHPFWFFSNQHFSDNKIQFLDCEGRAIRRQLVGFSDKRRVYWHFGVQARCKLIDGEFFFALTPHVTFSNDGKTPLLSKAQLHTLRRSFCRSWWNDRWRDLMQAFVAAIVGENTSLNLDVGAQSPVVVNARFVQFSSPTSFVSEPLVHSTENTQADDEIADQWEDDPEDNDSIGMSEESGEGEITAP